MMTLLDKMKSFFKRRKVKAGATKEKAPEAAEKKPCEASQQSGQSANK